MKPLHDLPPLPPHAEQHFIDMPATDATEAHRIGYLEWECRNGNSNPEVIFCVHGLTRNAHDFDIVASQLSHEYRIIALDVAGRGMSDWLQNPQSYNYETYVSDALAVIKHINIEQVHWLGTSMGGIIAMIASTFKPSIFKSLILNDIGHFIPQAAMQRIADYAAREHIFDTRDEAEEFLRKVTEPFAIHNPLHWKRFAEFSIWEIKDGVFTFACDPRVMSAVEGATIEDIDLKPFWQHVTCPTLLLRGTHSDVLLKEVAHEMAEAGHVTFVEFDNVGHAPSLMDDEQIDVIQDWIEKHVSA